MTKYRVFKRSCGEKYKEGSYTSRDEAELRLVDVLAYSISNFNDYTDDDINAIRE